uniref:GAG-pre-integrase domain-containing protein n=1 Tax=Lactuca sativa TaxID=4236 RepID=A0A9R1WTM0_LACSA|nr:hypothetical protein LSAT_V11C900503040 [Lactuca sativa]
MVSEKDSSKPAIKESRKAHQADVSAITNDTSTTALTVSTTASASQVTQPSVFAAITKDLWHHCLGHPSTNVLSSLRSSLRFPSSKHLSSICKSCVLGKLIKLPFSSSTSITHISFDIIHTNLWTSPIPSSSGHKYYILFLDDKTNFL